jgi:Acyl-CoA dehydrogenase, C-terminal domain
LDVDTRDLLREPIQQLLACPGVDLVTGLAELGWQEVVSDDPAGAVDLLFTEQGRAGRASACLDTVIIDAAGGELQDAEAPLAVIHPVGDAMCLEWGGRLVIDGVALSDLRTTQGCVVAANDAETTAYLVHPDRLAGATTPVVGFDPDSSLRRVRVEVSIPDIEERKCDWRAAIAAGRRALASEVVGNGSAMLDIAIDHVRQRTQFGRPIASNQTPRHRLAECHAHLAGARGLIDAAWKSGTSWDAWVAKTYAGYASDTTSRT